MTESAHLDRESHEERPSEVVTRFLTHFYAGRLDEARAMLTPNFSFQAPLADGGSREDYFAGADKKVGLIEGFRVVRQWEDGSDVATLYEIDVETDAGSAAMRMFEWHRVRGHSIESTVMVFDTVAAAADLLRIELRH